MTEEGKRVKFTHLNIPSMQRKFSVGQKGVKAINANFPLYEVVYDGYSMLYYVPTNDAELRVEPQEEPKIIVPQMVPPQEMSVVNE